MREGDEQKQGFLSPPPLAPWREENPWPPPGLSREDLLNGLVDEFYADQSDLFTERGGKPFEVALRQDAGVKAHVDRLFQSRFDAADAAHFPAEPNFS